MSVIPETGDFFSIKSERSLREEGVVDGIISKGLGKPPRKKPLNANVVSILIPLFRVKVNNLKRVKGRIKIRITIEFYSRFFL